VKKPDAAKTAEADKKATPAKAKSATTESYSSSGMKGYALQVGLFPTRDMADGRAAELKKKNLRSVALPKMIGGKKQYALVIGPYASIDEANKKKPAVAGACGCQTFVVKVD
jgi:septal ring-binding cell division protein DamX